MLGELYVPSGPAFETASVVLETPRVSACNVGLGCPCGCAYCYIPLMMRKSREECLHLRLPTESPTWLVRRQMSKEFLKNPLRCLGGEGFFLSFLTDPFLPANRGYSNGLINFLLSGLNHHKVATLSKLGISDEVFSELRSGVSIVSLDEDFRKTFEPNTASLKYRLRLLCIAHQRG